MTTIAPSRDHKRTLKGAATGFTLVETVVVMMVIGVAFAVAFQSSDSVLHWKQQGALRLLNETIQFLHHQAVADQNFYRLEFDFKKNAYRVGMMAPEPENQEKLLELGADAGNLTLALASFLNPSLGESHYMLPPPEYPSLYEWKVLLPEMRFEDIKTQRGTKLGEEGGTAYIHFSPRGFSEFAVIHLRLVNDAPHTILVNPFTGLTQNFKEYKEFQWNYTAEKGAA